MDTTPPMGVYLTNALKEYCDGIEVINHPMDNPRYANIGGLFITAAADMIREQQKLSQV